MLLVLVSCAGAGDREQVTVGPGDHRLSDLANDLDLEVRPTGFKEDRLVRCRNGDTFYIMAGKPHYRFRGDPRPVGAQQVRVIGRDLVIPQSMVASMLRDMKGQEVSVAPKPAPVRPAVVRPPAPTPERSFGQATILVDPGHGGRDSGAVQSGTRESDVNLAFSRLLIEALRRRGATVKATRTRDVYVSLDDRVTKGVRSRADLFLSVHANSAANRKAAGVEVFYPAERGRRSSRSATLARSLSDAIAGVGSGANRGPKRDPRGLRVLRTTKIPAVLVELGFLTNHADHRQVTSAAWQKRAAEAAAEAVRTWWRNQQR